jgi:hypothetical protein
MYLPFIQEPYIPMCSLLLYATSVTAFTSSMIVDQRHKKRQVELTIDY